MMNTASSNCLAYILKSCNNVRVSRAICFFGSYEATAGLVVFEDHSEYQGFARRMLHAKFRIKVCYPERWDARPESPHSSSSSVIDPPENLLRKHALLTEIITRTPPHSSPSKTLNRMIFEETSFSAHNVTSTDIKRARIEISRVSAKRRRLEQEMTRDRELSEPYKKWKATVQLLEWLKMRDPSRSPENAMHMYLLITSMFHERKLKSRQIWIEAQPNSGKSTFGRLMRSLLPSLELAAGSAQTFSASAFLDTDATLWLEDEWTPSKMLCLPAATFNKISEGDLHYVRSQR